MVETFNLIDGSSITALSFKDIADIIRDRVSNDLGNYIEDLLYNAQDDIIRARVSAQTDLDAYCTQLDEYHDCILDSSNELQELICEIADAKRLNKQSILGRLSSIKHILDKEV